MSQDIQLLTLCLGTVIPAIVGLITSEHASEIIQTGLGALMSVVVGIASTAVAVGSFNWASAGIATITTFVTTVVLARFVYKPTGITTKLQKASPISVDRILQP